MVSLEDARGVIAAAEKKAGEIGQPMNIAVVDSAANLVAFLCSDRAGYITGSGLLVDGGLARLL